MKRNLNWLLEGAIYIGAFAFFAVGYFLPVLLDGASQFKMDGRVRALLDEALQSPGFVLEVTRNVLAGHLLIVAIMFAVTLAASDRLASRLALGRAVVRPLGLIAGLLCVFYLNGVNFPQSQYRAVLASTLESPLIWVTVPLYAGGLLTSKVRGSRWPHRSLRDKIPDDT